MTRFSPLVKLFLYELPQLATTLLSRLFTLIRDQMAHAPEYIWFSFMPTISTLATHALYSFFSYLLSFVCLDVQIYDHDPAYARVMAWLTAQRKWGMPEIAVVSWDEPTGDDDAVFFLPRESCWYRFWYHGLVSFAVLKSGAGSNFRVAKTLDLRVYTWRGKSLLKEIMVEAAKLHRGIQQSESPVWIWRPDVHVRYRRDCWTALQEKGKRSLETVVLEPGCVESLIKDIQEFLDNEEWYRLRGIPYRRGYLLHGPPGTGKTSLVSALAGHFGLDIYSLPLTTGIHDARLADYISVIPRKSILLIEDIDATMMERRQKPAPAREWQGYFVPHNSNATLAGLLNAIDGIDRSEVRILIATTNHREQLDHALRRPGRFDVQVSFRLASRAQMKALFQTFYSPSSPTNPTDLKSGSYKPTSWDGVVTPAPVADSKFSRYRSPSAMASLSGPGSMESVHISDESVPPPRLDRTFDAERLDSALRRLLLSRENDDNSQCASGGTGTGGSSTTPRSPGSGSTGSSNFSLGHQGSLSTPDLSVGENSLSSSSLSSVSLETLSTTFANALPEYMYSMAALQGYLLRFKSDPFAACRGANLEDFRREQEEEARSCGQESEPNSKTGGSTVTEKHADSTVV